MNTFEYDISKIAKILGDINRATMLIALMQGKALTAGELALYANISPQTASNHLQKLLHAKLISCNTSGRHRYYRLTSSKVATAIESLGVLSTEIKTPLERHKHLTDDICFARTCYDHLAGKLSIFIVNALHKQNILQNNNQYFSVTAKGKRFFQQLNIDVDDLKRQRRQFAKCCLDWTEREYHIAGSLGAALLNYFLTQRLIIYATHKPRVVVLTTAGKLWLANNLHLSLP